VSWRAGCFALCLTLLSAASPQANADEAERFTLHCSGCHGMDGRGVADNVPTLHGLDTLLELEGGRSYLARVPGVAQAPLPDDELARLLNWVLARFSGHLPEPPYTAEEVGALRRDPLRDPLSARPTVRTRP
jgi:mono/diheme cytochrome c family protein